MKVGMLGNIETRSFIESELGSAIFIHQLSGD
jgi:hypothetical protein